MAEPAASLYGYDRDATVGQHVDMLFADPEEMETTVESLLIEVASGPVETQHWHRRADGSVFWATLSLSQLEDGELTGFVAVSQDTTEKHHFDLCLNVTYGQKHRPSRLNQLEEDVLYLSELAAEPVRRTPRRARRDERRMARLVDDQLSVARQADVVTDPERRRRGRCRPAGKEPADCRTSHALLRPLAR